MTVYPNPVGRAGASIWQPSTRYTTDYREQALKHVIESLDSDLFERVTGLTVKDFRALNEVGLFNAQRLEYAIYVFRNFETTSLDYALTDDERQVRHEQERIGGWETVVAPGDPAPAPNGH
ncbi:MAG: hypothetical protein VB040_08395 [Propionibacterium sp.]|nr:hypothetical protein [Propionibacterium sp.]